MSLNKFTEFARRMVKRRKKREWDRRKRMARGRE